MTKYKNKRMLCSLSKNFAKKINAEKFVNIGEYNCWKEAIYPTDTFNPTGKPGGEILATSKLVEKLEAVSTEMLTNKKLISVGYLVDVRHVKPASFGTAVKYESEVVDVEGNKVTFKTTVSQQSDGSTIGFGTHTRAIIGLE